METVYFGVRDVDHTARVYYLRGGKVRELPLRLDECQHSPTGLEWGYGGSGPAQLAYALLRHWLGCRAEADRYYQRCKWEIVAKFPQDVWRLDSATLTYWLHRTARDEAVSDDDAVGAERPPQDEDSGVDLGAEF